MVDHDGNKVDLTGSRPMMLPRNRMISEVRMVGKVGRNAYL